MSMGKPRRKHLAIAIAFGTATTLVISVLLFGGVNFIFPDLSYAVRNSTILISCFTAFVSAVGTVSSVILAWKSERRDAQVQALKIEKLEQELEALKKPPTLTS